MLTKQQLESYDAILANGLSKGLGQRGDQVCIEAALCQVLDLPHGDDPGCVARSVRAFKIALNDTNWSSPKARSAGLRDLGLAQLGSLGVVNDVEFTTRLSTKVIQTLIPSLFREIFPNNPACLDAAQQCEQIPNTAAAAADAAYAAAAAYAAYTAYAADAAAAAAYAAYAAGDKYLILGAQLALETLTELHSPGCALLTPKEATI